MLLLLLLLLLLLRHLRYLLSVEVKQQFFLVVPTEKHDLFGGAGRQDTLNCRPQKFKNARGIEQQTATEALRIVILHLSSVATTAALDRRRPPEGAGWFGCTN